MDGAQYRRCIGVGLNALLSMLTEVKCSAADGTSEQQASTWLSV